MPPLAGRSTRTGFITAQWWHRPSVLSARAPQRGCRVRVPRGAAARGARVGDPASRSMTGLKPCATKAAGVLSGYETGTRAKTCIA